MGKPSISAALSGNGRVSLTDALRRKAGDVLGPLRPNPAGLRRSAPPMVRSGPVSLFGDAKVGAELLAGQFRYGGQGVDVGAPEIISTAMRDGHPFSASLPSERFADFVHGFDWLADLLSCDGGAARAGNWLATWAELFPVSGTGVNAFAMKTDRLGRRLFHWGAALGSLPESAAINDSYSRQMHRLRARLGDVSPGLPRLYAQAAHVLFGAQLSDAGSWLSKGMDGLDAELSAQILPDGGHISRSPAITAESLRLLLITDSILGARSLGGSNALGRAIDRIGPMVQTLRHTDGGLGVFHGGGQGNPARLGAMIGAAPGEPQPFAFGPHSGFHRVTAGDSVLLLDTGDAPRRPFDTLAHIAPLALELSTADGRLIVNCGASAGVSPSWRRPVRAAAAHSTLILDDLSPGSLLEPGFRADMLGDAILRAPGQVSARRKEQNSGIWLETSHEGYKDSYGLVHRRRIFMGEDGDDIRGEDSLFVPVGSAPLRRDQIPYCVRFHFHPDVRVSLAQDLSSALLVQQGRAAWRFRTDGGPLSVEPSVYLGSSARPVRAQQLVIRGQAFGDGDGTGRGNCVRWSLRQLRSRELKTRPLTPEQAAKQASEQEAPR